MKRRLVLLYTRDHNFDRVLTEALLEDRSRRSHRKRESQDLKRR